MPTFAHAGVALHYEVIGDGPPLLLIAGLASDLAFWLPAQAALAARRQLIMVDNRGSGRSTPLDADSSIEVMADDCLALLRHLNLSRVNVIGHSMGGMIAQACAWRDPERIHRLVLAASMAKCSPFNNDLFASWATLFATTGRASWFRNLYHWVLSRGFFDDPRAVDALVQMAANYPWQQTPAALQQQVAAIAAFDATPHLRDIMAPVLVLAGSADLLFSATENAAFARALPHATLELIDGAAHSFPAEMPAQFVARALAFLDLDQDSREFRLCSSTAGPSAAAR